MQYMNKELTKKDYKPVKAVKPVKAIKDIKDVMIVLKNSAIRYYKITLFS